MLLSFRVANHRSIRDEQELLLLPAYDRSRPAVPLAAIYGANASGKTNLLNALSFMRRMVRRSVWSSDDHTGRTPFRLEQGAGDQESRFGVDVLINGIRHVYGFAIDDKHVREEWLYVYPKGRRRVLFERESTGIRFGDSFRGHRSAIEDLTRPSALLLTISGYLGLEQARDIFTWFDRRVEHVDVPFLLELDEFDEDHPTAALLKDEARRDSVIRLLTFADLGISSVRTERRQGGMLTAYFGHRTGSKDTELPLSDESRGTQAWFHHLGSALRALDGGHLLLIDELDASLHPLLAREFIRLFTNPETNTGGAQLIFTTHDVSLLRRHQGEEILARDEIWFTEKDLGGSTTLYPLTDFNPRDRLDWERRYLGGSVRAVPILDRRQLEDTVKQRAVNE
ncbi:ATP/GTP-binding protein [Nonomuraea sp. NPDC059194]|uniref:AAA family ATPase n=1 Tax=Nonomuraea sp. NPDC059194 TaxID=3346764 RepID=UPI00369468AE